jgi:dihydrofolate reductase
MRKLVLKMSISADGFVAGPNGEIDWLLNTMGGELSVRWIENTLWEAGVHVMGSRTFHDMASYWPTSADSLAAPMNEIPKVVFSKKGFVDTTTSNLTTQALKDANRIDSEKGIIPATISKAVDSWKNARVEKDIVNGVNELKKQDGKFILAHGGANFAQSLVKYGLIDEYRLVVHPVILGKGLPLFSLAPHQINLELVSSTTLAKGVIANIYRPV